MKPTRSLWTEVQAGPHGSGGLRDAAARSVSAHLGKNSPEQVAKVEPYATGHGQIIIFYLTDSRHSLILGCGGAANRGERQNSDQLLKEERSDEETDFNSESIDGDLCGCLFSCGC